MPIAIPQILSVSFLSSLNPFLLEAEIAAAVLLGIGIVFESQKYPEPVKLRASHFVMWGIVLETVFSIALFVSEQMISSQQRAQIIALSPRSLSPKMITQIKNEINAYFMINPQNNPLRVIVSSYSLDTESLILGSQIEQALTIPPLQIVDMLSSRISAGRTVCGVTVTSVMPALADWLVTAFSKVGLAATTDPIGVACGSFPPPSGGNQVEMGSGLDEPAAAKVFVGVKPVGSGPHGLLQSN